VTFLTFDKQPKRSWIVDGGWFYYTADALSVANQQKSNREVNYN